MEETAHYVDLVLRDTGHGSEIVEVRPSLCPQGHPLRGPASRGNVQVFHGKAPDGRMRRGWRCWTCGTVTWGV